MKNQSAITSRSIVSLRKITSETVYEICELSETLTDQQRNMVADNGTSIAEAHFSEYAWFRAIYADEMAVGFSMLHYPSLDNEDTIAKVLYFDYIVDCALPTTYTVLRLPAYSK